MTPTENTPSTTRCENRAHERVVRARPRRARTRTRFQRSSDRVVSAWLRDLAESGAAQESPARAG